ncbi:MAG: hypothetical protein WCF84_25280 [Anaerolineae bacterium]
MKHYRVLGLGLAMILIALALAYETEGGPSARPESEALVTALHYTPEPVRIETVLVTIPQITEISVTPTATPLLLEAMNPSIDNVIRLVFAQSNKWQLVGCCRQATLAPFYQATVRRRGLIAYGDGLTVTDGAENWHAAFAAVLLNQENGYRVRFATIGLGKGDPQAIVALSRTGEIGIRLQNLDAGSASTVFHRSLTLAPCAAPLESMFVIPEYGDNLDALGIICY